MLEIFNPWWEDERWYKKDYHLSSLSAARYAWIPTWIDEVSLEPFSLNIIVGPRQVGKTTGIKLLIFKLAQRNPRDVLFVDCGVFSGPRQLFEVLKENRRRYIFLDEVTSLPGWWKVIRAAIDAGLLQNSVLTLSSSSSIMLGKRIETFPGRMGKGKVIEVLPLSFPEFFAVTGGDVEEYLRVGGFPLLINRGSPDDLLRAFIGEMKEVGSLEIFQEVLSALLRTGPSAVSYRALASLTSGYSYKVVQEYVEALKNLFIVGVSYLKEGKRVLYRREKKFFFRDPIYFHIFSAWANTSFLESYLFESLVSEHFYRLFGNVYYYRNAYEVDVIAGDYKVEVKAGKPHRRYPKGVLVVGREELPDFLKKTWNRPLPKPLNLRL